MKATFAMSDHAQALAPMRRQAADALVDTTEFLLEEANRTAPIEEATLIGSGRATVDEDALLGAVSYDTPYAVRQHEDTRLRHDPGRRAKWLEATFKEQAQRVTEYLADRFRRGSR